MQKLFPIKCIKEDIQLQIYLVKLIPTPQDLSRAENFLMLPFELNVYNNSLTIGKVKLFWDCKMFSCLVKERMCKNTEKQIKNGTKRWLSLLR